MAKDLDWQKYLSGKPELIKTRCGWRWRRQKWEEEIFGDTINEVSSFFVRGQIINSSHIEWFFQLHYFVFTCR